MRQAVTKRLSKTPDGKALVRAVDFCGGWGDFLRATGYEDDNLMNWVRRGKLSQVAAKVIANVPLFKDAGWTKEMLLPTVQEHQWRDKPNWVPHAEKCAENRIVKQKLRESKAELQRLMDKEAQVEATLKRISETEQ